jgi:hypothetical protein
LFVAGHLWERFGFLFLSLCKDLGNYFAKMIKNCRSKIEIERKRTKRRHYGEERRHNDVLLRRCDGGVLLK